MNTIAKTGIIVGSLLAAFTVQSNSAASGKSALGLEPPNWVIEGNGTVQSGTFFKMRNTFSNSLLCWKKQNLGVDLGHCGTLSKNNIKLVAKSGGAIKYGEPVAIYVEEVDKTGAPGENRFIFYKSQKWGINIGWSKDPKYEWYVDAPEGASAKKGEPVKRGAAFSLRNVNPKDNAGSDARLVYCPRPKGGAWLKWKHDCTATDMAIARANKHAG